MYMTFAICGFNNKMHCEFLPKKSKVMLYVLAIYFTAKAFYQLYITNKMEHFSFKVGVPSVSEMFKRRLAYSVTVIILAYIERLSKNFVTKALVHKADFNIKYKCASIAVWSLVMSPCSCDFSS